MSNSTDILDKRFWKSSEDLLTASRVIIGLTQKINLSKKLNNNLEDEKMETNHPRRGSNPRHSDFHKFESTNVGSGEGR